MEERPDGDPVHRAARVPAARRVGERLELLPRALRLDRAAAEQTGGVGDGEVDEDGDGERNRRARLGLIALLEDLSLHRL